jgi:N6-L-threonylcarbamoyladenine synthase
MRRHLVAIPCPLVNFRYGKFMKIAPKRQFASNCFQTFRVLPRSGKRLAVLGIETSCDDTGVSVVSSDGDVLSNCVASQWSVHSPHGGIVPPLAAREHEKNFDFVLLSAMERSGLSLRNDIDAIGVTVGPGLASSLRVGIERAKYLSRCYSIPIIPINHLEAHSLAVRIPDNSLESKRSSEMDVEVCFDNRRSFEAYPKGNSRSSGNAGTIEFPFLVLLISGGHSQFLLCSGLDDYLHLGGTLDDSIGEAFDKVARLIGLDFSQGGAGLEQLAATGNSNSSESPIFPIPMRSIPNCDLSFSGLKSAVARYVEKHSERGAFEHGQRQLPRAMAANIASAFQEAACKHLEDRTLRALRWCEHNDEKISALVVCGGVASNQYIRSRLYSLCSLQRMPILFPSMELCTDNGAMIAWNAIEKIRAQKATFYGADEDVALREKPKWPLMSQTHPKRKLVF